MSVLVLNSQPAPAELHPLTFKQNQLIDQYTSNDADNSLKRGIEFAKAHPQYVIIQVATSTLVGAAGGTIVGGTAGFVAGFLYPPLHIPITAGGAVAGGVIGGALAAKYKIIVIQRSDTYQQWKAKAIVDKVYPFFQKFLEDDPRLAEFFCPTLLNGEEIIRMPVKAPDGKTYEKANIEKWLDSKQANGQPFAHASVIHGKQFTKADLVYDSDFHNRLVAQLKAILNESLNENVKKGLLHLKKNVLEDRAQLFSNDVAEVGRRFGMGELTAKEFSESVQKLKEYYSL